MRHSGIVDEISAHRGLASLPAVWEELAHGRVSTDDALRRASGLEAAELAERTARMLVPPTTAQSRARLQALLDQHVPVASAPAAPSRSRRWLPGVVAMVAVAAAVVLLVVPRLRPAPSEAFEAGYELELGRSLASERDAPAVSAGEVPRFRVDRALELTLRPAHRVTEAVDVRIFATDGGGRTIVLPVEAKTSARGVVTVLGRPDAWGLTPGRWRLTVLVGPAAGLPHAATDVRADPRAPYDVQERWIEVLPPAPAMP